MIRERHYFCHWVSGMYLRDLNTDRYVFEAGLEVILIGRKARVMHCESWHCFFNLPQDSPSLLAIFTVCLKLA